MKKLWRFFVFGILMVVLAGCGGNGDNDEGYYEPETSPVPIVELPSPAVAPVTVAPEGHILFSGGGEMDLPVMCRPIAAGVGRSFAVDNDGVLWHFGALAGSEPVVFREGIVSVNSSRTGHQAVDLDGNLVVWGQYTTHVNHPNVGISDDYKNLRANMVMSDNNSWFFLGVSNRGHLYGWGGFSVGLRNYTTVPPTQHEGWHRTTPFRMFEGVRYVSLANGSDWIGIITHADNLHFYGIIGRGNEMHWMQAASPPIMQDVKQVSIGDNHALIVTNSGRLYAFGSNNDGQIGNGTTTDVNNEPVFIMDNVTSVSAGSYNSFAVTADGRLYGWGSNSGGKLGDGTTTARHEPVFIMENISAVDAGDSHTLAVTTGGRLYAWGANLAGQLGDGTTRPSHEPTFVMNNIRTPEQ